MKKKNTLRSILLALLISLSIGSYIYINSIQNHLNIQAKEIQNTEEKAKETLSLPDVEMIKQVIQKSREFIPAS